MVVQDTALVLGLSSGIRVHLSVQGLFSSPPTFTMCMDIIRAWPGQTGVAHLARLTFEYWWQCSQLM